MKIPVLEKKLDKLEATLRERARRLRVETDNGDGDEHDATRAYAVAEALEEVANAVTEARK